MNASVTIDQIYGLQDRQAYHGREGMCAMYDEDAFSHLSPKDFDALDFDAVTLVDLREPHEVQAAGIRGTLVMPFSKGYAQFDTLPKDKPVVFLCRIGVQSELVAQVMADRGYKTASLDGGYYAYRAFLKTHKTYDIMGLSNHGV